MKENNPNSLGRTPRDRDGLKRSKSAEHVKAGRDAFALKRSSSHAAAAHAFLVWDSSAPMSALQANRNWLRTELEKGNARTKTYNEALEVKRKRGKEMLRDRSNGIEHEGALEAEADRREMIELALLDDKAFSKLLKVSLTVPQPGKDIGFHAVLRYVFDLYFPDDAPTISSYAVVLEAIKEALGDEPNLDVDAIVAWLKSQGFKTVLLAQREKRRKQQSKPPKPRNKGKNDTGDANPPEDVANNPATSFHADTVTWTLRVPSVLSEMPDRPFTVHLKPLSDGEVQVIGFFLLDTEEVDKLEADFAKAHVDARAPTEAEHEDAAPLPIVDAPSLDGTEEPAAHDANG